MAKTFDELAGRTTDAATRGRAARRTRELLAEAGAAFVGAAFVGACGRCGARYAAAGLLDTRQTACPGCRTGELSWPTGASTDAELDAAYDAADALLHAGDWLAADALLRGPAAAETTDMLLALLTATAPAKSRLPGRAAFLAEARSALRARGEDEAGLLRGLE